MFIRWTTNCLKSAATEAFGSQNSLTDEIQFDFKFFSIPVPNETHRELINPLALGRCR